LKNYFTISACIFYSYFAFAQTDTSHHGTIKISKPKSGEIYIKVFKHIDSYDASKVNVQVSRNMIYEPFPGVEGYSYPFNYTTYFNEKFKTKEIDLKWKTSDTVKIEVKVLANGKVYLKDKTLYTILKDVPAAYDEKVQGYELSGLQLNCLDFLKQIKTWEPAYVALPKQGTFKKQTVIKPEIIPITFSETLSIVFSTTPFEE
jgi:hypothetical protein